MAFNESDVVRNPIGRFAEQHHSEPAGVALGAPTVGPDFVRAALLEENSWHEHATPEMLDEMARRLNESRNFTTESIAATADCVWREHRGCTAEEEAGFHEAIGVLREHGKDSEAQQLLRYVAALKSTAEAPKVPEADIYEVPGTGSRLHILKPAMPDGVTAPVPSDDPRLQTGEVFDRIMAEGSEFQRSEIAGYPQDTQAIRFQANRPLSRDEAYDLSGVIGYANSAAVGGEPLDDREVGPSRDTPYSFIAHIDTNKGKQGDFEKFETMIGDLIANGSAPRKTNSKGPVGSRAVEPFPDDGLTFEIYYQV